MNRVAYRLDLLIGLEDVHNLFHVSQLRKYVLDPDHAVITELIKVILNLAYEERPIQILDRRVE